MIWLFLKVIGFVRSGLYKKTWSDLWKRVSFCVSPLFFIFVYEHLLAKGVFLIWAFRNRCVGLRKSDSRSWRPSQAFCPSCWPPMPLGWWNLELIFGSKLSTKNDPKPKWLYYKSHPVETVGLNRLNMSGCLFFGTVLYDFHQQSIAGNHHEGILYNS